MVPEERIALAKEAERLAREEDIALAEEIAPMAEVGASSVDSVASHLSVMW